MPLLRPLLRARRAFTLVEVLIASTIAGLVLVGILAALIQGLRLFKFDSFRLEINHDIRSFTDELTTNATFANYFLIFTNFTGNRTTVTGNVTTLNSLTQGTSGDFLVLVFKDDADDTKIASIVGYYRDVDAAGNHCLRKFTSTFSPTSSAAVWTLLPPTTTVTSTHTQIIPDLRGQGLGAGNTADITLGAGSAGLFYNFWNRSVIVRGQIVYTAGDKLTKQAVSTYNFTVSPRG
jgi:prepilin-type N-terminal cleavage/methylation domain-containing protein